MCKLINFLWRYICAKLPNPWSSSRFGLVTYITTSGFTQKSMSLLEYSGGGGIKENMMIPKSSFSMQEDTQIFRTNLWHDVDVIKKNQKDFKPKFQWLKKRIKKLFLQKTKLAKIKTFIVHLKTFCFYDKILFYFLFSSCILLFSRIFIGN